MRRGLCLLAAAAIAVIAACASFEQRAPVEALAPGGTLREGLYPGTPTSIVGEPSSPDAKGVGFDLGRALAARAGVRFEAVVFPRNAEVLAAAKAGKVDMVFTNATPARREDLDFSPPVLSVEQGFLVPNGSAIRELSEVDRPQVRVGVSAGSTSEALLSQQLRNATVVRTASIKEATDMLAAGRLDAFATNKPTLFEMSETVPGSRVLPGSYGVENFAIGIPKGRAAALSFVNAFVEEARAQGMVARSVARAAFEALSPSRVCGARDR